MGVADMTKSQENLLLDVYDSLIETWEEVPAEIKKGMFHNSVDFFIGRMFGLLIQEIRDNRSE